MQEAPKEVNYSVHRVAGIPNLAGQFLYDYTVGENGVTAIYIQDVLIGSTGTRLYNVIMEDMQVVQIPLHAASMIEMYPEAQVSEGAVVAGAVMSTDTSDLN